jgi:dipeptide transport system substrate-binding protein
LAGDRLKTSDFFAAVLVGALAVAIPVDAAPASATETEHEFVVCAEADPVTLSPVLATDNTSFAFSRPIFDRLLAFEFGGTKVTAGLAERWTVAPDGKSVTFVLRKGVQFHRNGHFTPTRELTADDVIFSFERMRDSKHPFHKVSGGDYKLFRSMELEKSIRAIEKINDHEVRFVLSKPESTLLANAAMELASITSAEYGAHLLKINKPELLDQAPIGTGPFALQTYKKGDRATFVANRSYYRGPPRADRLTFQIEKNPEIRLQKLINGQCQLLNNPRPEDLPRLRADKSLRVVTQPGLNIFYLAFNTKRFPYSVLNFRKAIHHAIDREKIVKDVFRGLAQVAKNPIPPNLWSYDRKIQDLEYNPEKSKELLKSVELPSDFKIELSYMPVTRAYNPDGLKVGQLMKNDLEAVGLKVNLSTKEWADYLQSAATGDFDVLQIGWTSDNGDPDNFLNSLLSCAAAENGNNYAHWCDAEYSHAVARARVTTTIRRRTVFYEKAQKIFKSQVPWITLAHVQIHKAMARSVEGYKTNPFGHDHFDEVRLSSWGAKSEKPK